MTPKEKAKELVYKKFGCSKRYALMAVDEILKTDPMIVYGESDAGIDYKSNDDYWQEVKEKIKLL